MSASIENMSVSKPAADAEAKTSLKVTIEGDDVYEKVLTWAEETGGTVFVPDGKPVRAGYFFFGAYDKSGQLHDSKKIVTTLEAYFDLLKKHGRSYKFYQVVHMSSFYLIPSNGKTMARFVKTVFPDKYEKMGSPDKVKFNPFKWDFRPFADLSHMSKNSEKIEIPKELSRIIIGPKGVVTKTFLKRTGTSFSVTHEKESDKWYVTVYGEKEQLDVSLVVMRKIIEQAKDNDVKLDDIPQLGWHSTKKIRKPRSDGAAASGGGSHTVDVEEDEEEEEVKPSKPVKKHTAGDGSFAGALLKGKGKGMKKGKGAK